MHWVWIGLGLASLIGIVGAIRDDWRARHAKGGVPTGGMSFGDIAMLAGYVVTLIASMIVSIQIVLT